MAKFFVNRGGGRAPEGPFEEAQIIRLIAAKKLASGDVCRVGGLRFMKLAQHPPFAAALREAGVDVPEEAVQRRARAAPKTTNRGLLLVAVLCIFGLGIAAVGIGSYVMFSNGAMPIRAAVPTDTELLVEAQSVRDAVKDFEKLRVIEPEKILGQDPFGETSAALTDAFALSKLRSKELVLAFSAAGVAARKLEADPETGVFLSFTNAAAMNALLALPRFKYLGLVAKNGRKYALSSAVTQPPAGASGLEQALFSLSLDGQGTTLVWFETSKVLFWGSPSFAESVARVLSLDVPGLEQSPAFKIAQQELKGRPNATGYLDATKLAQDPRFAGWFAHDAKPPDPVVGSLELLPAGLALHFVAHSSTPGTAPAAATSLELAQRLPAETLAYLALSLDATLSGAEREQRLLERISAANGPAGAGAKAALDQLESRFSLKLGDFLGMFADRAATALVVPDDYALALGEPRQMAQGVALEEVFAVKDEARLRATFKQAIVQVSQIPGLFKIQELPDGDAITTIDGSLTAEAHFAGGLGMLALGGATPVRRAVRAFAKGENTLDAQAAYHAARTATPSPTELDAWVDVGRVVALTQSNLLLAARAGQPGFALIDALRTTGPDRVTASLGVSREAGTTGAVYRINSLNFPLIAAIFALRAPGLP